MENGDTENAENGDRRGERIDQLQRACVSAFLFLIDASASL